MTDQERVCLGAIAGAHGVRGAVRIKSFTENPADIAAYGPLSDEAGERRFEISGPRQVKGGVVARIEGVENRDQARALKGTRLFASRAALPKARGGEFYHADLLGLAAEGEDGAPLGVVAAVHNFGAGDVLEITPPGGGASFMVSFSKEAVPEIDLEGRRLTLIPAPEDGEHGESPS